MNFLKIFSKQPVVELPKSQVKHKWQLTSRSYAPPVRNYNGDLTKLPQPLVEKLLLGVTTYLWECLITGDMKKEEIIGSDTQVLDELLIKAKAYGRQIIKDENGQSFILEAYQEPIDPTTLPMRRV
jgi:hypothetical protein